MRPDLAPFLAWAQPIFAEIERKRLFTEVVIAIRRGQVAFGAPAGSLLSPLIKQQLKPESPAFQWLVQQVARITLTGADADVVVRARDGRLHLVEVTAGYRNP